MAKKTIDWETGANEKEEEYGADCSAEFIAKLSCYMVWFKEGK